MDESIVDQGEFDFHLIYDVRHLYFGIPVLRICPTFLPTATSLLNYRRPPLRMDGTPC